MRRGVPAPESSHLHARSDMKSGRNHPLGKEKNLLQIPHFYSEGGTVDFYFLFCKRYCQELWIGLIRRRPFQPSSLISGPLIPPEVHP